MLTKNKLVTQYKKGAIRVYEDEKYLIILPKTHESMLVYGLGTTWCMVCDDENIFDSYKDNPLFIIIIRNSKIGQYQEKYLCQFETHGVVNLLTEPISYEKFFRKFKELVPIFKDLVINDKYKQYTEFEKNYFTTVLIK